VDIVKENINNTIIEIIGKKVQRYIISFIFILGILGAIFSFIIANKNISYLGIFKKITSQYSSLFCAMPRRQNPLIAQLSAEPTSLPDTKYTRIFDLLFFFICLIKIRCLYWICFRRYVCCYLLDYIQL
jgi:hypothetical protein